MPTISWNNSTKVWNFSFFPTKTDNGYDDEGTFYHDQWGYGIKKRLIGDTTWQDFIFYTLHDSDGQHSINAIPSQYAEAGYEYQGYRLHVTGYWGSESYAYTDPSDIIAPLGGGATIVAIPIKSVDALADTKVLATVLAGSGGIHEIGGKANSISEATILVTVDGQIGYYLTGTVRVSGAIIPNIRIIAVKTDGSKSFSNISNTNGTFSVSVEPGTYQVLGVYTDVSGNKFSSLITPYVEVA